MSAVYGAFIRGQYISWYFMYTFAFCYWDVVK